MSLVTKSGLWGRGSECSSWASSIGSSGEIVQNANTWSYPRPTESEALEGRLFRELKFENHWASAKTFVSCRTGLK